MENTTQRKKNEFAKTRPITDPYEVWENKAAGWKWLVLKKWQVDDNKPYARWFCYVTSPITGESGDYGDVYVSDILQYAVRTA